MARGKLIFPDNNHVHRGQLVNKVDLDHGLDKIRPSHFDCLRIFTYKLDFKTVII